MIIPSVRAAPAGRPAPGPGRAATHRPRTSNIPTSRSRAISPLALPGATSAMVSGVPAHTGDGHATSPAALDARPGPTAAGWMLRS